MVDLETLESREFNLVGWTIKRHPAFVRIYDIDGTVLYTLKKGEIYDNVKAAFLNNRGNCRFTIKTVRNNLTRELDREGSLDKRDILSDKLAAFEYADDLTDKLD